MNEKLFKPSAYFGKGAQTSESHDARLYYSCCIPCDLNLLYGRDVDGIRRVNDMEAFVEKIHYDIEEVQVYFFSGRTRRKVAEILEGYPEFSSAFGSKYVEIFAKNTSKGTALNALASRLGIAKEEIACIGDSANDLPMFEAAGLKIAMGNAVPELKKKADIVTYSNHIDGAAKAIEQYIL